MDSIKSSWHSPHITPECLTIERKPLCKLINHIGERSLHAEANPKKPTFHWYIDLYKFIIKIF